MRPRSLLSEFLFLVLFAASGAVIGVAFAFLSVSRVVGTLHLGTNDIVREADRSLLELASSLFTGSLHTVLPILLLVLGVILLGIGLLLHFRQNENKGKAALGLLIGLLVGCVVAVPALLFLDAPERAQAALEAAGMGAGPILRALLGATFSALALLGVTIGLVIGAARSSSWGRRIGFGSLGLVTSVVTVVILVMARPPIIEVPANAPQLAAGTEGTARTVWIIGGADKAVPVELDYGVFLGTVPGATPLKLERRNVARAIKAAKVLPLLHPRSVAAEHLVAAGALSAFEATKAARTLLDTFQRRGKLMDGAMALALIGRLAPTPEAVKLLERATRTEKLYVGSSGAKQLCGLVRRVGDEARAKRLSCGSVTKAETGVIKGTISLRGRPLRRTPIGLIEEEAQQAAEWVKKGAGSAASLAIVAGTRTGNEGQFVFENIHAGTYLLAIAPRRPPRKSGPINLTKAVSIVVPEKGGVVELGDIEAGGARRGQRSGRANRRPGGIAQRAQPADGQPGIVATRPDAASADEDSGEEGASESDGEDGGDAVVDRPEKRRPTRPLPAVTKRLIAKVRPAGPNRVIVPEGFGDSLLDTRGRVLSPGATVVPHRDKAGRTRGLRLEGIYENGVLVALGFLDGDIIKTINGRPVRSDEDLVNLVDHLEGTKRVRIRVERAGRQKILNIDVGR